MNIQIFTLCDSAQEYNGKLVIVGAFNEITASSFPAVHPEMAIVVRTIIENEDKEGHDVEIRAFKSDTGKEALIPHFKTRVETKGNIGQTVYSNVILRTNNVPIPEAGKYIIRFSIDGTAKEIPFLVRDMNVHQTK
jgi:hypothetical protein